MFISPVALSFAPFPFYPLHAPQAGPQKTSQISVLLLQVASLDDFSDASDMTLITSSCIRATTDALHPPTYGFFVQFSAACIIFSYVFKKNAPRPPRWEAHF